MTDLIIIFTVYFSGVILGIPMAAWENRKKENVCPVIVGFSWVYVLTFICLSLPTGWFDYITLPFSTLYRMCLRLFRNKFGDK